VTFTSTDGGFAAEITVNILEASTSSEGRRRNKREVYRIN